MKRTLRAIVLAPILAYQRLISPALPRRCKYYPTCSEYAVDAIRELGVIRGTILTAWRLLRCNPWSHGGYDPVEDRPLFREEHQASSEGCASAGTSSLQGPRRSGREAEHSARFVRGANERKRSISRA